MSCLTSPAVERKVVKQEMVAWRLCLEICSMGPIAVLLWAVLDVVNRVLIAGYVWYVQKNKIGI
jgi:hypothetical protein